MVMLVNTVTNLRGPGLLGSSGLDFGTITRIERTALMHASGTTNRADEALDHYRVERYKQRFLDAIRKSHGPAHRTDEQERADEDRAYHLARELEQTLAKVVVAKRSPNSALALFQIDQSLSPGAKYARITTEEDMGEAITYGGSGTNIPKVGLARGERIYPSRAYVTSAETDMFERAASDFAGTQIVAKKINAMRRTMDVYANKQTWGFGSEEDGLPGVLNYPFLPRVTSAVEFNNTTSPLDILAELHRLANYAEESSGQTCAPDSMVMSPRLYNYCKNTRISPDNPQNILQAFVQDNDSITSMDRIFKAREMRNSGSDHEAIGFPPGFDGILFFVSGDDGILNQIPQLFTLLPPETRGYVEVTNAYMKHAGVRMDYVDNQLLAYVKR